MTDSIFPGVAVGRRCLEQEERKKGWGQEGLKQAQGVTLCNWSSRHVTCRERWSLWAMPRRVVESTIIYLGNTMGSVFLGKKRQVQSSNWARFPRGGIRGDLEGRGKIGALPSKSTIILAISGHTSLGLCHSSNRSSSAWDLGSQEITPWDHTPKLISCIPLYPPDFCPESFGNFLS